MKYCRHCGSRQQDENTRCEECGAELLPKDNSLDDSKILRLEQQDNGAEEKSSIEDRVSEYSAKGKVAIDKLSENIKDRLDKTDFEGLKTDATDKIKGFFSKFTTDPKWQEFIQLYQTKGWQSALNLVNIFKERNEQYEYFFRLLKYYYIIIALGGSIQLIVKYFDIPFVSNLVFYVAEIGILAVMAIYSYVYIYSLIKTGAIWIWLKYLGVLILGDIVFAVGSSLLFFLAFLLPLIILVLFGLSIYVNIERLKIVWSYKRYLIYIIILGLVNGIAVLMEFNWSMVSFFSFFSRSLIQQISFSNVMLGLVVICLSNAIKYFATRWVFVQEKNKGKSVISTLLMLTFLPLLFSFSISAYLAKFFDLKDKDFYTKNLLADEVVEE